jgi:hypothetical protein
MRLALAAIIVATRVALAQPGLDPAEALREANAAAGAGDWAKVAALTEPFTTQSIAATDRAEAFRLHGLAAFFANQQAIAEHDFVAYLRLDLDGHLDPALYPPEAINFFNDVRARHAAELRALRPPPRRYAALTLLPPFAQFQNGERTKGWVFAGLIAAFAVTNITTYFVIRSWCHDPGDTCDDSGTNHFRAAQRLDTVNALAGVGLILTYAYSVYDGVRGYRLHSRAYVAPEASGGISFGFAGNF